jgi:hypothetical protein
VNELRLLAGKDGADLRLEQAQLASVYRSGAVDGDGNLSDAIGDHTRQIEACPDMTAIGRAPAVVGWNRL